jgi:hypothetical protein
MSYPEILKALDRKSVGGNGDGNNDKTGGGTYAKGKFGAKTLKRFEGSVVREGETRD